MQLFDKAPGMYKDIRRTYFDLWKKNNSFEMKFQFENIDFYSKTTQFGIEFFCTDERFNLYVFGLTFEVVCRRIAPMINPNSPNINQRKSSFI